ncbi:MAG: exonuclease domain-containing protein [Bacteroidota bacterium]
MYAILDIESTGGRYNEEGIMEIAIYRFDGEKVTDRFMSLVNPERDIQPFVVKLTGINTKMLRSAPKFHEVAKRIIEITQDTVLVAHNAQFDYRILRTEFRRLGYNFERKTLCTVDLSKKLLPDAASHSLGKLVRSLGIPVSDRHRANGDALATLKLFKLLLVKDSDKSIVKQVIRAETLGELTERQLDIVESLPSEIGIYYMHNKDGEIIFLSKTKNIKKKVNQHFTNDGKLGRTLQKETRKVTFERTGSKLVAILKEKFELKSNKPRHNKKIKSQPPTHGVYIHENSSGKLQLKAEQANGQVRRLSSFNSLKASKNFMNKVMGEHKIHSMVNPDEIHKIIAEMEGKYSLQNRDVVLLDRGRELGEKSVFLVKNGIFQGFGYADLNHQINNIPILESIITPMGQDLDTTFIIESYLRQHKIKMVELES